MEPTLVRKGENLPPQNHMYSYLTIAILSESPLLNSIRKSVKKFKFEKGYQFNMRGFSQAHLICATMQDEKVCTNFTARASAKVFRDTFQDI